MEHALFYISKYKTEPHPPKSALLRHLRKLKWMFPITLDSKMGVRFGSDRLLGRLFIPGGWAEIPCKCLIPTRPLDMAPSYGSLASAHLSYSKLIKCLEKLLNLARSRTFIGNSCQHFF